MAGTVNINLPSQIYQQALTQGIPPSIALAVAQQESGIAQWTPSGDLVTGTSGEIGVFQIMPQTAVGLGIDPTDVDENISGGISLLSQLYDKYGNWPQALSANNSGSPSGSPSYASSVLNIASQYDSSDPATDSSVDTSDLSDLSGISDSLGDPNVLLIGGVLLAVGLVWWMG